MRIGAELSLAAFTTLAAITAAVGQTDYSTPSDAGTTTTSSYSSPTYSSSAPTAPAAPRTGLYTTVTKLNAAADNTVDDYTRRPTLIDGKQYFAGYGDADLVSGAFAFQGAGWDWFGAAIGGPDPDEIRAGMAKAGAWGGGVIVSLAKSRYDTPAGSVKTTLESDGLGFFGDFSLGGSDVYGQLAFYTGFDALAPVVDNYVRAAGADQKNTVINLMAGWKRDATTEGTHAMNAEAILNHSLKREEALAGDSLTFTALDLWFYHGYILKAGQGYSVFLGSNSELLLQFEDWNTDPEDRSHYRLAVSPNLAFQKTLRWGFEAFAGGSVTVSWDRFDGSAPATFTPAIPGADERTDFLTGGADVALGLRWVMDNLAVEGSLRDALLANGPHFIGGDAAPGMFLQMGVSLGI